MFVGVHERQLDDKGRLALPSGYRAELGDSCYLVFGKARCVDVMSRDEFERQARDIIEQERTGQMSTERRRAFAHSATLVAVDKQGRITIEAQLRAYARLETASKVMVSGNLDHIELWNDDVLDRVAATGRGEMAGGTE